MEKRQFDEYLGGDVSLPRDIDLLKFLTARAPEMQAMTEYLESQEGNILKSQKVPTHMRRQLMAHNSKRTQRRWKKDHKYNNK